MKRIILTITLTITLTLTVAAQTGRQLKVYMKGGLVDKVQVDGDASIGHSRTDLNGVVHDDYVSMVFKDADGRERQYLVSQLDSLVLPNGRRVVFLGSTVSQPVCCRTADDFVEHPRRAPHRSSFSGRFPGVGTGNVTFKWTENDRIRLDVGYASRAEQLSDNDTKASFFFDGADDLEAASYRVYYPERSVTIKSVQTQNGADNTDHVGGSGDCGTAIATRNVNDNDNVNGNTYHFTLEHKAAYLCFLPHIDHLPSVKLTKITLSCSAAIAGTYELSGNGLYNASNTSSTITLNLVPQKKHHFFIGHDRETEQDSCAAYMVIAPQGSSQTFTATYYITDTLSHISKVYRQTFSFQPVANTVYPVTCHILDEEFRTIDLGLSCNWSNVNIGAVEPSKAGTYYADPSDGNAALLAQTVVTQWLLPDEDQRAEILEKCQWTFGEYNGQAGYFVEGAVAAKEYGETLRIFLPCESGTTKEACLSQNSRPVEVLMVDLGLSSGTKWAARNLGATSVEDYGNYYAWGEVDTKDCYNYDTYKMRTGSTYLNLGEDYIIAGTQNDAAAVNWGGIWTLPTKANFEELMNTAVCTWNRGTINGVNGYLITGPNGNRIFLPDAGMMSGATLDYSNAGASYQTANQSWDRSGYNWTLSWHRDYNSYTCYLEGSSVHPPFGWDKSTLRYYGRSVRAVCAPNGMSLDGVVYNIRTDSSTWKLGDTEATLYGTLSSTTPIKDDVTVGFVIGDSTTIDKDHYRFIMSKTTRLAGPFSETLDVYDNIGYYYRAFIETADTVFYGKARHYGYEMVDLGLSVKWANMNIGADQPSDYGNYYAWGETEPKNVYSTATYQFRTNQNLGEDMNIAGTDQDVAHVKMGNAWRMPNYSEMKELIDSCSWVRTTLDNVSGYRVTSNREGYKDKSIFLPAAGYVNAGSYDAVNLGGSYWTSSQGGNSSVFAWSLSWHPDYDSGKLYYNGSSVHPPFGWDVATVRYFGRSVRAVAVPNTPTQDGLVVNIATDSVKWKLDDTEAALYGTVSSTTPLTRSITRGFLVGENDSIIKGSAAVLYDLYDETDKAGKYSKTIAVHDNFGYWFRAYIDTGDTVFYGKARHYGLEIVDLGLPSGTKWANLNVGASYPEEYGDYYAWGETSTKSDYSSATYLFSPTNLNIGEDYNIMGTELDAAHVNMGNAWQLPSKAQLVELCDNCTWTWTSVNNVSGYRVTGPNKNSIFLPASGLMIGTSRSYDSSDGDNGNHGGSYQSGTSGDDTSIYNWTLSWRYGYSSNTIYVQGGDNHPPFGWDVATYRYYGRTVRAVFVPNLNAKDGTIMNVETLRGMWSLDDAEATIYGKWSSTTTVSEAGVNVGFIVGDSANIVIGNDRANLRRTQHSTQNESFQTTLPISDNMGYWYRAYLEYGDTVVYGTAYHIGLEKVDLGLPSGTLWANMNVGASNPEDYGNYYAWGERTTKESYTSGNYQNSGQNPGTNGDIAGIYNNDAARFNMGEGWQMPTKAQIEELRDKCSWVWTCENSVNGYRVIGPNKRYIFLPSAGYMNGTTLCSPGYSSDRNDHGASYWCSLCNTGNTSYAWSLSWRYGYSTNTRYVLGGNDHPPFGWDVATVRWFGRSVRAVAVQTASRP